MRSALPLLDGALLRPDPTRVTRMAMTLRRLDVLGSDADAVRALVGGGDFSATEIVLMASTALSHARRLAAESRAH